MKAYDLPRKKVYPSAKGCCPPCRRILHYRGDIMNTTEWINSPKTISKSKKQYAHFDYRTDIASKEKYITDPKKIAKHGFYPFIHYDINMIKYNKTRGKKSKKRSICYASHIDRCIYQYYNFLLNNLYNNRVLKEDISEVALAYRTDLHKNNVYFAKKAFDFIKKQASCYVMIGDFTNFFDNLDHQYLKEQWCSLLDVSWLPEDHYKIFKSVTEYSFWEREDLLKLNNLEDTSEGRRRLNSLSRVLTKEQFHNNKSMIKRNKNCFGIPQGSPISGQLANIYMLNIDKEINNIVKRLGGLYMRYSDDFIIVLPNIDRSFAVVEILNIHKLFNSIPGLSLQPDKTQCFHYCNNKVVNCGQEMQLNTDFRNRLINFLGFSFDGKKVYIRQKTTSKYYYRMYRKAKTIANNGGYTSSGKHISGKNLYQRYSIKGAYGKNGNFISYALRAKKVFGDNEAIDRDIKNHMQKIRKAIGK